ncbi:TonB-dependent receptor plug [Sphingobium chlorophenolicum L-1]|uniref:TonB-dependent receptor plug n=1 Tax=Sphingobium chlorophenolicum L-1 TaxID=690566 RepID=F6F3B2_SPHCR|nr:TonB-dependent receptor [Sphingobium chlorophenolicum]AEG50924.1 TonB-dependent receptor plug [Sphingobium chlorophenolicum L-1]
MKARYAISASLVAMLALPMAAHAASAAPQEGPSAGDVPVAAPNSADAANSMQEGDIVVTALRQSSLLSKTPIAVTAVTGEGLRTLGITDVRSLATVVPNVTLTDYNQGVIIQMRGVSSSDTTEKGDPSAAFLLDGIYIARVQDQVGSLFDVERVEVLRGPQGTLYGRNTTAGAINIITTRPKYEFGGSVDAEYGNFNALNLTGIVNIPVAATLGLRAAVNYQRRDNYIRETVASPNDLDPGRDLLSGRLSFGGEVGERFNFVIRGDYARDHGSTFGSVPLSNFFQMPLVKGVDPTYVDKGSDAQRSIPFALQHPSRNDAERYGIMGEFSYDFGGAQLTYLGGYRKSTTDSTTDLVFAFGQTPSTFDGKNRQQSHELRLAFGSGSPLHGQTGLYYFEGRSSVDLLIGPPLATAFFGPTATGYDIVQRLVINRSKGVFGQVTYDLTPDLHITGGIRYTEDFKSRDGTSYVVRGATRTELTPNTAAVKFHKVTWRAGIDYDVPDLGLIYASVASGYKSGGFNDGCPVGSGPGCSTPVDVFFYQPETLTAYEAGVKFRFGNMLRINTALFHYDYSGLQLTQVTVTAGGNPVSFTRNAAKAKVDGVEFEAQFTPTANDRVDLSVNYVNARYTDFVPDATFPNTTNPLRFDGRLLDRSPKWSGIASYTHIFPLDNGATIELMGRVRYSGDYYLQDLNNLSQFRQPHYTKSDVTVTYNSEGKRWYLQGYIKNIENEITLGFAGSGLSPGAIFEQPRTYGVRAGMKF